MKSKIVLVLLSLVSTGLQAGVVKGKIKDAQTGEEIDACYRACPLIDKALKIETKRNERTAKHAFLLPVVDHEYCVGCAMARGAAPSHR